MLSSRVGNEPKSSRAEPSRAEPSRAEPSSTYLKFGEPEPSRAEYFEIINFITKNIENFKIQTLQFNLKTLKI